MPYPPAAADPVDAGLPDGVPGRAEEPTQPDQPENPTEPEKPGAGGKPSAGGTDPSAPGGSQSDGQTGPHHRRTRRRRTGAVFQKREGRINEHLVSQYPAGSSQRHGDPGGDLPAAVGVFRVFTGLVAGGAAGRAAAYERQSAPAAGDHAKRLQQQEGLSGGEDLEKRGEVYYDARTGTYYIVPNAAGN